MIGLSRSFPPAVAWIVAAGCLAAATLVAQEPPEVVAVYGRTGDDVLVGVRSAAFVAGGLLVLTGPEPALHFFSDSTRRQWGREGEGPSELADPRALAVADSAVAILDGRLSKIVRYRLDGSFLGSRPVNFGRASRMMMVGTDTLIELFEPFSSSRTIARLRPGGIDTVFTFEISGDQIRLEAEGAPSFILRKPFVPSAVWTVLASGRFVLWRPDEPFLRILDRSGRVTGHLPVPVETYSVDESDREFWFENAIPRQFLGQRVFEPIRRQARRVVKFPGRFPLLLELKADPSGGLWLRKTTRGSGEVWVLLDAAGRTLGSMRVRAHRRLLAVGTERLAALAVDDLGVETVEMYMRPEWSR